jgi:hypothetical protein
VGTACDEPTDPQTRVVAWADVGTAIRHEGWEALNLLDGRKAAPDQGLNFSWWALNVPNTPDPAKPPDPPKAVRLGSISSRFAATGEGTASAYLAFYTKPATGDVAEALRITERQTVGVGTPAPHARLSIVAEGGSEIAGTAQSTVFRTSAGELGKTGGDELALASIGFHSANNTSLGIRARRISNGDAWQSTAIGIGMDVDNTVRVSNGALWLDAAGNVGVGRLPSSKLHTGGDLRVDGNVQLDGNVQWAGDHAGAGHLNLGGLRMCWGQGQFTSPAPPPLESWRPVAFPSQFSGPPVVVVSLDDPGYGKDFPVGAVGAIGVSSTGFDLLYKRLPDNQHPEHTINYSWIAIGS